MLRIGIVGVGFMGMIHYLAAQKMRGGKVVALSSRDKAKLAGDWRNIKGNFGPPGTMMDLKGVGTYESYADLLADPKVDIVDICLPPHAHLQAALAAFAAGKHVFCEKPIALTSSDAAKMTAAAAKAGKLLLIGHVLPFFPEFAYALKIARGGKYGKLLGGHFKRIISEPTWLPNFYNPKLIGGPMLDLHVHDAHLIRLLFGMPTAVYSSGRMRGEVAEFFTTQFQFEDSAVAVAATSGVIAQQGRPFTHGYEIYLEKATLTYDMSVVAGQTAVQSPVTLYVGGRATRPELSSSDPIDVFSLELNDVAKSVRTGEKSANLDGALARDAVLLCERQTESIRKRQVVRV